MTLPTTLSARDAATFAADGALRVASALDASLLGELLHALDGVKLHHAGTRLHGIAALDPFLAMSGPVGAVAAAAIGTAARPVRALLFDKTASANWAVPWHQDRTVPVAARVDVAGFGPWTMKSGLLHVAPPYAVLAKMVTLRVHLDAVPGTNAPLLIAPGSHRLGQIPEREVRDVVQRCGTAVCEAEAGDIWLYSTPILHASEPARAPRHRRVLQVDFAADALPGGLAWLGV